MFLLNNVNYVDNAILKNIIKPRHAIIIVNIWAIFKKPKSVFVLETFKNSIKNLDNDIKINIKIEIKPDDNLLNIEGIERTNTIQTYKVFTRWTNLMT